MPTIRQLECFVAVADEGSFTRAAATLHVSQPGLSSQIAALEREIETTLFERRTDGAHLTPTGRAVLPHAREALSAAARLERTARQGTEGVRGTVAVATVYSISMGLLPPLLGLWRTRLPEVRITLREFQHSDELRASMARRQADLALGPVPARWAGPVFPYRTERFVVLLGGAEARSAPNQNGTLRLETLAEARWIHYAQDNGLSEILESACRAAGFVPEAAVRVEQTASVIGCAYRSPPAASRDGTAI